MRNWAVLLTLTCAASGAGVSDRSGKSKLDMIMDYKARRGSVVVFTPRELEQLGVVEIPRVVPDGFREPRVYLSKGAAAGTALIDFKKLRHAQGNAPSWLDNLIDGERPVRVEVEVESANGWCTVYLKRMEISKIAATGKVLEVLVKAFFLSLYPNAKVNEPFQLEYNIDHIELRPTGLYVTIKK